MWSSTSCRTIDKYVLEGIPPKTSTKRSKNHRPLFVGRLWWSFLAFFIGSLTPKISENLRITMPSSTYRTGREVAVLDSICSCSITASSCCIRKARILCQWDQNENTQNFAAVLQTMWIKNMYTKFAEQIVYTNCFIAAYAKKFRIWQIISLSSYIASKGDEDDQIITNSRTQKIKINVTKDNCNNKI